MNMSDGHFKHSHIYRSKTKLALLDEGRLITFCHPSGCLTKMWILVCGVVRNSIGTDDGIIAGYVVAAFVQNAQRR